jgi:hypothetical protein
LDFEKNANFFAENWQKSVKIVIITSTPGALVAIAYASGTEDREFDTRQGFALQCCCLET